MQLEIVMTALTEEQTRIWQHAEFYRTSGRLQDAARCYRELVDQLPGDLNIVNLYANTLISAQQFGEAIEVLQHSLGLDDTQLAIWDNLGVCQARLGKYEEALATFDTTLYAHPKSASTWNNKGLTLHVAGAVDEAIDAFEKALALDPKHTEAYNNLGNAYLSQRKLDEAAETFSRAIQHNPTSPSAYNNLGIVNVNRSQFSEAILNFTAAVKYQPDFVSSHVNLGNCYKELGSFGEAMQRYKYAIALQPTNAQAQLNIAILQLLQGEWNDGWRNYEWRWAQVIPEHRRTFHKPKWLGSGDVENKRLLLFFEQGVGDFIQQLRYLPWLSRFTKTVILETPPSMLRLLEAQELPDNIELVAVGAPLPDYDLHCAIMSLPFVFGTQPHSIPPVSPFTVEPAPTHKSRKFKVGLCWKGSSTNPHDWTRSLSLEQLEPILALYTAVDFYSLQHDVDTGDYIRFVTSQAVFADYKETAEVIASLDLVITVDTSVAHLAGTLGKPTWVLINHVPDYRWGRYLSNAPTWYPSVRLYRQSAPGAWAPLILSVAEELDKLSKPE